jgi:hypothetical protein
MVGCKSTNKYEEAAKQWIAENTPYMLYLEGKQPCVYMMGYTYEYSDKLLRYDLKREKELDLGYDFYYDISQAPSFDQTQGKLHLTRLDDALFPMDKGRKGRGGKEPSTTFTIVGRHKLDEKNYEGILLIYDAKTRLVTKKAISKEFEVTPHFVCRHDAHYTPTWGDWCIRKYLGSEFLTHDCKPVTEFRTFKGKYNGQRVVAKLTTLHNEVVGFYYYDTKYGAKLPMPLTGSLDKNGNINFVVESHDNNVHKEFFKGTLSGGVLEGKMQTFKGFKYPEKDIRLEEVTETPATNTK